VDDIGKTWEDFQKDLKLSTEVEIAALVKKADYQLDNNGTKEDLFKQVDSLITKLQEK
jgi:dephospho-CoA kinase